MNPEKNIIFLQGKLEDRSEGIAKAKSLPDRKLLVTFNDGRSYSYNQSNVEWLTNPTIIDLSKYYIYYNDEIIDGYIEVFNFKNRYYKFKFANKHYKTYAISDLVFKINCNEVDAVKSLLGYLKKVARKTQDQDFLLEQLNKIDVKEDSVLYKYAIGAEPKQTTDNVGYIYPFGSNKSQRQAVNNAFKYDVSLVQGPPGTGKTQTILNIIANAIIRGKTIAVVSNNNTATKNIQEKLEKYGFGFLTAFLGNKDNLDAFFEAEKAMPDEVKHWVLTNSYLKQSTDKILKFLQSIDSFQEYKEKEIRLSKYIDELHVEKAINDAEYQLTEKNVSEKLQKQRFTSRKLLSLKATLDVLPEEKFNRFFIKLRFLFRHGIFNLLQFFPSKKDALDYLDHRYYDIRIAEIQDELTKVSIHLQNNNIDAIEKAMEELSLLLFKHFAFKAIESNTQVGFERKNFRKHFESFMKRYPIMLNTTQALLSSTGTNCRYDYVIIDESSQVSLTTAAVAMSIAKNIVLVGDSMQLPHIIKSHHRKELAEMFTESTLRKAYSYADYSILDSFKELYKDKIRSTLLREHYRCDPHIIDFCNKRFYDNQLLLQTRHSKGGGVEIVSTKAHSENNRANERQVCVIEEEVLPNLAFDDVGIIAPYNNQVDLLKARIKNDKIKIDTVHSFQGQENDAIILSTVSDRIRFSEDDEFVDFLNDPKLLNVAISRAKKKLIIIISEELMAQDGAILSDFSRYIKYFSEAGQIKKSKIYSVFDLMYKDYSSILEPLRAKIIKVSEFESENIIAMLIKECISKKYKTLGYLHNYPLRKIINANYLLDEEDRRFVSNELTHCDFVIYNQFGKKPCFVIEIDGKQHNKPKQKARDNRKDRLLKDLGIPVYRIPTTSIVRLNDIEKLFAVHCKMQFFT